MTNKNNNRKECKEKCKEKLLKNCSNSNSKRIKGKIKEVIHENIPSNNIYLESISDKIKDELTLKSKEHKIIHQKHSSLTNLLSDFEEFIESKAKTKYFKTLKNVDSVIDIVSDQLIKILQKDKYKNYPKQIIHSRFVGNSNTKNSLVKESLNNLNFSKILHQFKNEELKYGEVIKNDVENIKI